MPAMNNHRSIHAPTRGTPAPIRKVSFAWERRPLEDGRAKALAVYHFLSEEWSPWIALRRLRARWPQLSFACRVDFR
jgi:hypothetical protein